MALLSPTKAIAIAILYMAAGYSIGPRLQAHGKRESMRIVVRGFWPACFCVRVAGRTKQGGRQTLSGKL
jgi:hypothetical protein